MNKKRDFKCNHDQEYHLIQWDYEYWDYEIVSHYGCQCEQLSAKRKSNLKRLEVVLPSFHRLMQGGY